MFSHVMVGTNDLDASQVFYDAALAALGVPPGAKDSERVFYRTDFGMFAATKPVNGAPATVGNGGTIGFAARSAAEVDAWHAAGVANGGTTCENPPGVRDFGVMKLYLAYLRDPSGNKICAMHRMTA